MVPKPKTSKQKKPSKKKPRSRSRVAESEGSDLEEMQVAEQPTCVKVEEPEMMPRQQPLTWDHTQDVKPVFIRQRLQVHLFHTWLNGYEEATGNIYTRGLCSEIIRRKASQVPAEIRSSQVKGEIVRCRVQHINPNSKMLLATKALQTNQLAIELKGKFMLTCEYMADKKGCGQNEIYEIPTGSFVFLYELWRNGIAICVDTRTYGNDARFVRKSCNPNAQIKHCFKQGLLHLYIVAKKPIGRDCEVTIPRDDSHLYIPNKFCSSCSNASESVVMRAEETRVLGNQSGVVAVPNHTTDGISQQPIHPIPSTSTSKHTLLPIKIKLKKKSIDSKKKRSIPKKLPHKRNIKNTGRPMEDSVSLSTNGEPLMENCLMEISPSDDETQHYNIAEREQVERQQSETSRSQTPCVGCPQLANAERELGTCSGMTRTLSPMNQTIASPHAGCGRVVTPVPIPAGINQQISNHCMQLAQQNQPQYSNQPIGFWMGVSVGLSTPIYQLVQILKKSENRCPHCATQEGHQNNQDFTASVREYENRQTQTCYTGTSNCNARIQCDLEDMPNGGSCHARRCCSVMHQSEPLQHQQHMTSPHCSRQYEQTSPQLHQQHMTSPHCSRQYEQTSPQLQQTTYPHCSHRYEETSGQLQQQQQQTPPPNYSHHLGETSQQLQQQQLPQQQRTPPPHCSQFYKHTSLQLQQQPPQQQRTPPPHCSQFYKHTSLQLQQQQSQMTPRRFIYCYRETSPQLKQQKTQETQTTPPHCFDDDKETSQQLMSDNTQNQDGDFSELESDPVETMMDTLHIGDRNIGSHVSHESREPLQQEEVSVPAAPECGSSQQIQVSRQKYFKKMTKNVEKFLTIYGEELDGGELDGDGTSSAGDLDKEDENQEYDK